MTIYNLTFLFISFLGLILSIFFFIRKIGDSFLNRLIALYTLLFSHEMLINCLKSSGHLNTIDFVHLNLTRAPMGLIYGPLIYIYVRRTIIKEKLKKSDFLFLIPPLIIFLLTAPFYFINAKEKLEIVINCRIFEHALLPNNTIWVILLIMYFYAVFTFVKFKKFYGVGFKELTWLKCFVGSYFGFVFLFSLYIFLIRFDFMDSKYYFLVDGGIVIFILTLAYFGIVQPNVFDKKKSLKEILPFTKYSKTGLSTVVSDEVKKNLMMLMEKEKPYLENNLRLNHIAQLLNVSRNHASQIINERFNLSFFDFINKYRVEEAKRLLLSTKKEKLNIDEIAYSVGFNNRASFYKAFKKFTSLTPTSFLRTINSDD